MYDFLLVINANLHPLTQFPSYGWFLVKFSLAIGRGGTWL